MKTYSLQAVTFMATKMEVEFIKRCLQEVVFFKIALKYPSIGLIDPRSLS